MRFIAVACLSMVVSPFALVAAERPIDAANSTITIHVDKSGLFSAAAHEHEVSAPVEQGAIDESAPGRVWFTVRASRLTVLPEPDQAKVQKTMQSDVLESDKFPDIKFESTMVRSAGENKWLVTGNLTLHGKTSPITVEVLKGNGAYTSEVRIKQTQFGIKPVTIAGGTIKVKDELKIEFVIHAK